MNQLARATIIEEPSPLARVRFIEGAGDGGPFMKRVTYKLTLVAFQVWAEYLAEEAGYTELLWDSERSTGEIRYVTLHGERQGERE